jgi:hypothetical protein
MTASKTFPLIGHELQKAVANFKLYPELGKLILNDDLIESVAQNAES